MESNKEKGMKKMNKSREWKKKPEYMLKLGKTTNCDIRSKRCSLRLKPQNYFTMIAVKILNTLEKFPIKKVTDILRNI